MGFDDPRDCAVPHVILVSGGSRAGKSELIRHIVRGAPGIQVASLRCAPAHVALRRLEWSCSSQAFKHLLIELPPAADPADYFGEVLPQVGSGAVVQTVATAVDAETVFADFRSHQLIRSRIPGLPVDDVRSS